MAAKISKEAPSRVLGNSPPPKFLFRKNLGGKKFGCMLENPKGSGTTNRKENKMSMGAEVGREDMKETVLKLIKDKLRAYKRRRKSPEREAAIKALKEIKVEIKEEPIY